MAYPAVIWAPVSARETIEPARQAPAPSDRDHRMVQNRPRVWYPPLSRDEITAPEGIIQACKGGLEMSTDFEAGGQGPSDGMAASKVSGPATGLMVTAIIGIILLGGLLIMNVTGMGAAGAADVPEGMDAEQFQAIQGIQMMFGGVGIAAGVIGIAVGVLILVAAGKMKKLESYGLAVTASVLAMIPCVSPCCIIGLPIGIWSLVVLLNQDVKSGFGG